MISYKDFALKRINEQYMDNIMNYIKCFIKDQFPITIKIYKKDFPKMIEDDLIEFKQVLFNMCGERIKNIKIAKQIDEYKEEYYLFWITKK